MKKVPRQTKIGWYNNLAHPKVMERLRKLLLKFPDEGIVTKLEEHKRAWYTYYHEPIKKVYAVYVDEAHKRAIATESLS